MDLYDQRFDCTAMTAALEAARRGRQALHVWRANHIPSTAPDCFRRAWPGPWAHLLDTDADRLRATARRLGIRQVFLHHEGRGQWQHVDLCGLPLAKAIGTALADNALGAAVIAVGLPPGPRTENRIEALTDRVITGLTDRQVDALLEARTKPRRRAKPMPAETPTLFEGIVPGKGPP